MATTKTKLLDQKLVNLHNSASAASSEEALILEFFLYGSNSPEKSETEFFTPDFEFTEKRLERLRKPITSINFSSRLQHVQVNLVSYLLMSIYLQIKTSSNRQEFYVRSSAKKGKHRKILDASQYEKLKEACIKDGNRKEWTSFSKITKNDASNMRQLIIRQMTIRLPKVVYFISRDIFGASKVYGYNDVEVRVVKYTNKFLSHCFNDALETKFKDDFTESQMEEFFSKNWLLSSAKTADKPKPTKFVTKLVTCTVAKLVKILKVANVKLKKGEPEYDGDLAVKGWTGILRTTIKLMSNGLPEKVEARFKQDLEKLVNQQLSPEDAPFIELTLISMFCNLSMSNKWPVLLALCSCALALKCDERLLYIDTFKYVQATVTVGESTKTVNLYKQILSNKVGAFCAGVSDCTYIPLQRDDILNAIRFLGSSEYGSDRALSSFFKCSKGPEKRARKPLTLDFEKFILKTKKDELMVKCEESVVKFERFLAKLQQKSGSAMDDEQREVNTREQLPYIPSDKALAELAKTDKKDAAFFKRVIGNHDSRPGYVQKFTMIIPALYKVKVPEGQKKPVVENEDEIKNYVSTFAFAAILYNIALNAPEDENDEDEIGSNASSSAKKPARKPTKQQQAEEEEEEEVVAPKKTLKQTAKTVQAVTKLTKKQQQAAAEAAEAEEEEEVVSSAKKPVAGRRPVKVEEEEEVPSPKSTGSARSAQSGKSPIQPGSARTPSTGTGNRRRINDLVADDEDA